MSVPFAADILSSVERWGYVGLALGVFLESAGLPIPGETALLLAAFAAAHGALSLPGVIAVAAVAGILGDNMGYALGRRLGRPWAQRYGRWVLLTPRRLRRVERFFHRFGPVTIALARFLTGIRVVAAFAAGMGHMPWRTFLFYNALGAVVWATAMGLLGYTCGAHWRRLEHILGLGGGALAGVVIAAVVALWAWRKWREHRQERGEKSEERGARSEERREKSAERGA